MFHKNLGHKEKRFGLPKRLVVYPPGSECLTTSPAGAAVLILTSELSSSQTHQNPNFPLKIVLHGIKLAKPAWHSV